MVGPAQVLDLRGLAAIDAAALRRYEIHAGDIILLRTDNSSAGRSRVSRKDFTYVSRRCEYLGSAGEDDRMDYLSDRAVRQQDSRFTNFARRAS